MKPWRSSFGPLPAALAGRIPVEPEFSERIRRAATRFYIDEMAAIRDEHDETIARERSERLSAVMNATIIAARTGVLSPTAARLLEACDTIFSASERKSAADRTSGGDRRPLPEVAFSDVVELRAGQQVPVFGDVAWDGRRA
ncbi:MAG: hypothetical protein ACOZAM_15255 [Pseudomonadota bacterium]